MNKIIFAITIIYVFFVSCKNNNVQINNFEDLFMVIDTISFENSKESIMTYIVNLQKSKNGKLYLCEHNQIFFFDEKGKFIKKSGRKGDGPTEYGYISDMKIYNDTLVVFDAVQQKLNFLDSNLNYIKTKKLKVGDCEKFIRINNDYFFYNRNVFDDSLTVKKFNSNYSYTNSLIKFPYNSVMQVYMAGNKSFVYAKDIQKILVTHLFDQFLKVVSVYSGTTVRIPLSFNLWRNVSNEKMSKYFPAISSKTSDAVQYLYDKLKIYKIFYLGNNNILIVYKNRKMKEKYFQYFNMNDNRINFIYKAPEDKELLLVNDKYAYFIKFNYNKASLTNPELIRYKINR